MFKSMGAATRALIFINVLVYLGQISSQGRLTDFLYYSPMSTLTEPWRMITSGFAHSDQLVGNPMSILHIALNMYTLYILGNLLEPMLGARRFTILYLLSIFGGSVLVLLVGDPLGAVIGASGGIFGLMAAFFVVLRTLGGNANAIVGVIAINLVFSFLNSGVSWQAHIGGLVTGAGVAFLYSRTRSSAKSQVQNIALIAITVGLVAISFVRATLLLG
jgi:membrane associated rhomboid family serine protease